MYQREVTVPATVRKRPPNRPNRRRKARRRRRQMQFRFLTALSILFFTGILLAGIFAAPPDSAAEPLPPQSAPVYPLSEEPAIGGAEDAWYLTLVNPWNPLPEDYRFTIKNLSNGHSVDERCYADLQAMLDGCRAAGLSPLICSSYRSREKQDELFRNKVEKLSAQGLTRAEAEAEAGKEIAVPGTSEHQLGLAVDIVDVNNQNLDRSQEGTAVQKWLMEHSWEYGFILRYPNEKSEITGIIYEPWHYRYVGKDAAKEIDTQGICLEEYLEEYLEGR